MKHSVTTAAVVAAFVVFASAAAAQDAGVDAGNSGALPTQAPAATPTTDQTAAPLDVISVPHQAAPVATESAPQRDARVAEVIVTAQRREERAQDVPISITVLDAQQLSNANISSTADLATYTPSLSANTRFGNDNASFAIRGFTQDLRTTASVGTYFAEVIAPRGQSVQNSGDGAGPGALFDLENVQVLKGPQGTLFGRNTTGGAVLIVPKKPTDKFEGYVELSGGDYDMFRQQAVINVPVTDWFKFRLGVDNNDAKGWMHNITDIGPRELNDINYTAYRLSTVLNLTDAIENYTILTYTDSDNHGNTAQLFACNPGFSAVAILAPGACRAQLNHQAANGTDGFYDVANTAGHPRTAIKEARAINTTTFSLSDDLTLKNILAYSHLETWNTSGIFGTQFTETQAALLPFNVPGLVDDRRQFNGGASVTNPDFPVTSQETWVEELQLQGTSLEGRLHWQTGLYYEHSRPDGWSGDNGVELIDCDLSSIEGPPSQWNCFDPLAGTLSGVLLYKIKTDYLNEAAYAQATYDISEQFSVTGGLRYTRDRTRGNVDKLRYTFALNVPLPPIETIQSAEAKSDAPTGVLELSYKPAKDILTYAKYSRGYRQGSVNMNADANPVTGATLQTWDPEHVNAYEIGAKTQFGGIIPGRINVAAFYNDLRDMQLQNGYISQNSGTTTAIINAGRARIAGAEVEAFVELVRDLTLGVSYAYLNTKLVQQDDHTADIRAAGGIVAGATSTPIADEGETLPFAPDHTAVTSLTYRLPLPVEFGDVSLGAVYVFTGKRRTAAGSQTPYDELSAFRLLNLNLNWMSVFNSAFDLSLFGTNVLNEKYSTYYSGTYSALGFESRQNGAPRMYGARLKYSFGR
jgi:outer membrane receptor protein involved in Fe transport